MPVTAVTGTAQVLTDTAAYDRMIYTALRPLLVFDRAATVKPFNQTHPGSSVLFNIINDLAVATTPLTELSDVTAVAQSDANVTVTLNEYGNGTTISAKLRGTAYLDEMARAANTVGFNAGKTLDTLARDPLLAGTNAIFADNYNSALTGTSRATTAAGDVLQANGVRLAVARLKVANALPYDGTYYKGYIAPEVAYDFRAETGAAGWREPHVNAGNPDAVNPIWQGSIGSFEGVDFIESSRLAAAELPSGFVNGGAGSTVDVYPTVICGQECLAKAFAVNSGPFPRGVMAPVTDLLQRFRGVGWWWLGGYARFREASIQRIETASSIGANT